MPHDIFISYSTANADWADGVCKLLEGNAFACWMAPRDISPGANWGAEIVRGINGARVMLLLLSSASNHSRQVAREVQLADSAQLGMIPVLLEPVKPEGDFLYFIGNTQWLTAIGGSPETHASTLLAAVRTELANAPARQAVAPDSGDSSSSTSVPTARPDPATAATPVATGGSGAAAAAAPAVVRPATIPALPQGAPSPGPSTAIASGEPAPAIGQIRPAPGLSKGPWLWLALGALVVVIGLWIAFPRKVAVPPPQPSPSPTGVVGFTRGSPWTGTYQGDAGKEHLILHVREVSSAGRHDLTITVDNLSTGKMGETAFSAELGPGGKLNFSLGEPAAPQASSALEMTSDKQSLTGEWHQLKANRSLRVDFRRTSSQP